MQSFLAQQYWHNTVQDYCIALGTFIVIVLLILILKKIILKRIKNWASGTERKFDDFFVRGFERTVVPLLYIGGIYIALQQLTLAPKVDKWTGIFFSICVTFFVVRAVTTLLQFMFVSYLSGQERGEEKTKQVKGIMVVVSALIWGIGILVLLSNWGFNVTTFVAGLGIGGIAIALAAQTILGDLFSYFVIFFDKPFEIGDFIIVQDKLGTVEYIGIKTTRLRSLSGEQLVFSNTDLTNSRVHNYKRMATRRIVFKFNVALDTPRDKLALIPGMVKKAVADAGNAFFDRSHLLNFGDFCIVYENVFIVQSGDYNLYMDIQQAINLQLFEAFEKEGIKFGIPTQNLFLNQRATETTEKL
ncbi:mechanosensitive ion channel family protein [Chitinophaga sp. MM2321]|uniref:mechanosensitive ion channel family protein n=1 Tax=Chitinophaga sp. MM2321 TaxID=3137178 RepID=UPI0032D59BB8